MQLDEWYLFQLCTIQQESFELLALATPHQPRYAQQLFNYGMIAPGNHNFERFAALCNTPGEAKNSKTFGEYHPTNRSVAYASGG